MPKLGAGATRPLIESAWTPKACDICGERSDLIELGRRNYDIAMRDHYFAMRLRDVLCQRCGFVFEGDVPSQEFLNAYYGDAFSLNSDYQTIEPDYDTAARIEPVRHYLRPGSSIFEVGASHGAFCHALSERGFMATGVDPVAQGQETAVKRMFVTRLSERSSQPAHDAVVSYYVLEHVVCAVSWLVGSAASLKPGGLLILEVPNFATHPSISLSQEHMLHFTPPHLAAVLVRCGFEQLPTPAWRPSREFGFVAVARLSDPERLRRPADYVPDGLEARRVREAKDRYGTAMQAFHQEDDRATSLARELAAEASKHGDAVVYFWPANEVATRISAKLADLCPVERRVVDNARSKIGLTHRAFDGPIRPPEFDLGDRHQHIFVLCSPSWNAQIECQIRAIGLADLSIHDGSLSARL